MTPPPSDILMHSDLPLTRLHRGKVRDIYALGEQLLFVASDRLSAFDVVFNEGIPDKGRVLTQVSLFWTRQLAACQPYHLVSADVAAMDLGGVGDAQRAALAGRTMLVEKLEMLPVECVVRGYLVGSGWKDYQRAGAVCGHTLPAGMQNGDRLDEPLFTPATKAELGAHDENISFAAMVDLVGADSAEALRRRSLEIFAQGAALARERGLVLVDTKLEFGRRPDGTLVLGDEVLTPDSSRYWDLQAAQATPRGQTPPSFDKQLVRDYLEGLDWNKAPPPPPLRGDIIARARARYLDLVERLTGAPLTW